MQIIVTGHPDLSSQLCEAGVESSHPPLAMFSHRMNYPLLTLWKWLLVTSTTSWMPLDDVNLLIWKRASPETKHALVCLASPVGSHNLRVLWRLRPALAWTETASLICLPESPPTPHSCHPKGNSTAKTENGAHTAAHSTLSSLGEKFLYCSCQYFRLSSSRASFLKIYADCLIRQGYFLLILLDFSSLNHQLTCPLSYSFLPHFDEKSVISPYQLLAASSITHWMLHPISGMLAEKGQA